MKTRKYFLAVFSFLFVFASLHTSALAQSSDDKNKIAGMSAGGLNVRWDLSGSYSSATITISTPDGQVIRKEFKGGATPEIALTDKLGERLPDGVYTYELRISPFLSAAVKEALAAARAKGNDEEAQRDMRKRGMLPTTPTVQSGSFSVINGSIVLPGAFEERGARQGAINTTEPPAPRLSPAKLAKVSQHHRLLLAPFDFVIADDLIVQGSTCSGLDCVNGEVFGFDTLRLKENNTRLQFDDTSTTAGFATNNWQIRANSSASGGNSFLGFVDQGATGNSETGTIVFEVDAGAPANSLRVSSLGRIGNRTATPVLDVHTNTSNTPAMRFEQNNSGGFTAQTWDVAGNEANFFVRDVTSGSTLPFRIRPGAPTSSLDISANGSIGIGTATTTGTKVFILGGNDAGSTNAIQISSASGLTNEYGFLSSSAAGDFLRLGYWNGSQVRTVFFDVGTTGNVGIGTSTPDQMLSVNGGASKVGGGSWSVFSDRRLKTTKGNFNSGLKALMLLQPVRFEYMAKNPLGLRPEVEYVGFEAQALQKIIPEAVTQGNSGYLLVNNDPILWTMLNAIKEQQKQIEDLKREVRQLRSARKRK
jgi:Chaperone of endosialidase